MAQYCKLAGKATNCTDNCRICLEEETNDREIEIGDRVRYIAEDAVLDEKQRFYPPKGTIGVVVRIEDDSDTYLVRWPDGTTKVDGFWCADKENVELA